MNNPKFKKFDFAFIGGGVFTIHFFATTASNNDIYQHPLMEEKDIAIIDKKPSGVDCFKYCIEANNKLSNFIGNAQGKYKKSVPHFSIKEKESYPMLYNVVSELYSEWGKILDSQLSISDGGSRYLSNALSLSQNHDNSWDINLCNGDIVNSKKVIIATGGIKKHAFSNQILSRYKTKIIHSDDFQRIEFIKYIRNSKKIGILGASHSAMSSLKLIQRINPKTHVSIFYKNSHNINELSEFYKPIFESTFHNKRKQDNVKAIEIDDSINIENIIVEYDYFIEATGYTPKLLPLFDRCGNKITCTQMPNCRGEICHYPNKEKLIIIKNLYGMGLSRPIYGMIPEIKAAYKRVIEGVAFFGEVELIYNILNEST